MGGELRDGIAKARAAIGARQYRAAEDRARALLVPFPDAVDALEILFLCRQQNGDPVEAENILRRVIALAPDKQWPRGDLARLLLETGRMVAAEQALRDAVAADPGHADAHAMLGALLSEREMLVPGAVHLESAIALAGPHPQLLANLGRNLMRQGKLDEAEPLLQRAAAAVPDMLAPRVHLAELAEQRDQFDRAITLLDQAAPIAAREGRDVLAQRAHLLGRTPQWRDGLALLDTVPDLTGTPLLLRARLRDRAELYAEAWADAVEAKAQLARQRGHGYRRDEAAREFAALASLADRLGQIPTAPVRHDVPQPIFILGFPRSGTTLTEQVLASHARIRPGGELPFVTELTDFLATATGAPFPAAIDRIAGEQIATRLRDFYLARAETYGLLTAGADYFTDKMPLNEIYLPLLRLAFPQAPLIAVARDPRDVLVSVMHHDMTHGFHCGYRLADAAHHFAAVDALTAHYHAAGIVPHILRYESFIADQAGETARLMASLGLAVEPAQLRFHESRRHAPTPSYAQVREPLHGRAIGRWHHYEGALATVADMLRPALARGGY